MRFYGRQEGMTNAILSCRSPYEILRRRSKSKNPSLSCCRSPYEILQGRARLVISLFLLPFSLWDSAWHRWINTSRNRNVAVLLMRFRVVSFWLVDVQGDNATAMLPFSLWDSQQLEQEFPLCSASVAVLLMRFSMKKECRMRAEIFSCRSPYEIQPRTTANRTTTVFVAVLLMRFLRQLWRGWRW